MRSTFFGLQIGQAGLRTSQFGLDVTSHNIANVETDGFTRQRIVQTAIVPATGFGRALPPQSQLRVGVGTEVKFHDQIRSEFLDRRFRTENSAAAYWTTRSQEMGYLQSFFDSVNEETSINHTLQSFFAAVNILAGDTVEIAPRTLMRDSGLDLVQQFNMIFNGLVDLQRTQNDAIRVKTGDINRIASEIVKLNEAIYLHEITGHRANDLRDERNLLVDQLSTLVDVDYRFVPERDDSGNLTGFEHFQLRIGGELLVHHDQSAMLGVREVDAQGPGIGLERVFTPIWVQHLAFTEEHGAVATMIGSTRLPADTTSFERIEVFGGDAIWVHQSHLASGMELDLGTQQRGQLQALINMRDGIGTEGSPKGVPYYIELMNNLARAVVQQVNAIHRQGWSDHPVLGSRTGINFFDLDGQWLDADGNEVEFDEDRGLWILSPGVPDVLIGDDAARVAYEDQLLAVGFIPAADPGPGRRVLTRHATPPDRPEDEIVILQQNAAGDWVRVGRPEITIYNPHAPIDPNDPNSPPILTFQYDISQITAETIRLSAAIRESASNIAASSVKIVRTGDADQLQAGNNNNMRTLHDLFALERNIRLDLGDRGTVFIGSLDGFATAIRHDVGSTTGLAVAAARNGHTLITAMGNQRESVAGVSLDEEMVSLIRFQHAYSGAARVVTAMDDALDRLINGTGRVGL